MRAVNRAPRTPRRGARGQSLVELALVAPILLVLIVGGAQIGALVYGGISVATAAQEGGRVASEQPIKSNAYVVSGSSTAVGPGATCPASGNPVCAAVSQAKGLLTSVSTTIAPERAASALRKANEWLARHGRVIGLSAAAIVGTYFVVTGIVHLV